MSYQEINKIELKSCLERVDMSSLISFAKNEGLQVEPGSNKEDIISQLIDAKPGVLHDLKENIIRLELRSLEHKISKIIEDQKDDISQTFESKLDEKYANGEKQLGSVRNMLAIVGLGLTISLTTLGIVGGINLSNLNHALDNVENLEESWNSLYDAERTYLLGSLVEDLQLVMDQFSSSLPDRRTFEIITTNMRATETIVDAASQVGDMSEDAEMMRLVHRFYNALHLIEDVKQTEGDQENEAYITKALSSWSGMLIDDAVRNRIGVSHEEFIQQANGYRYNIIGILQLRLMNLREYEPTTETLDDIEDYFDISIREYNGFHRPHNNLALVSYYRYLIATNNEERLEYITKGLEQLENARQFTTPLTDRSILYNNIAYYKLLLAKLQEVKGNQDEVRDAIKDAFTYVQRAQDEPDTHPSVFVTEAQILSYNLSADDNITTMSPVQKQQQMKEILGLLERAYLANYNFLGVNNINDFLVKFPELKELSLLAPDYMQQISETLKF